MKTFATFKQDRVGFKTWPRRVAPVQGDYEHRHVCGFATTNDQHIIVLYNVHLRELMEQIVDQMYRLGFFSDDLMLELWQSLDKNDISSVVQSMRLLPGGLQFNIEEWVAHGSFKPAPQGTYVHQECVKAGDPNLLELTELPQFRMPGELAAIAAPLCDANFMVVERSDKEVSELIKQLISKSVESSSLSPVDMTAFRWLSALRSDDLLSDQALFEKLARYSNFDASSLQFSQPLEQVLLLLSYWFFQHLETFVDYNTIKYQNLFESEHKKIAQHQQTFDRLAGLFEGMAVSGHGAMISADLAKKMALLELDTVTTVDRFYDDEKLNALLGSVLTHNFGTKKRREPPYQGEVFAAQMPLVEANREFYSDALGAALTYTGRSVLPINTVRIDDTEIQQQQSRPSQDQQPVSSKRSGTHWTGLFFDANYQQDADSDDKAKAVPNILVYYIDPMGIPGLQQDIELPLKEFMHTCPPDIKKPFYEQCLMPIFEPLLSHPQAGAMKIRLSAMRQQKDGSSCGPLTVMNAYTWFGKKALINPSLAGANTHRKVQEAFYDWHRGQQKTCGSATGGGIFADPGEPEAKRLPLSSANVAGAAP